MYKASRRVIHFVYSSFNKSSFQPGSHHKVQHSKELDMFLEKSLKIRIS